LDVDIKNKLLEIRLLILRAAQKDSLQWWEDESLTRAGDYLVERLFIMDQEEAARSLAMEAGKTRYRMAFEKDKNRLHLFRLDLTGQVELGMRFARLSDARMPRDAITSIDTLRDHLVATTGTPAKYEVAKLDNENRLQIRIKNFSARTSVVELAKTLAWACLESKPNQPYFPFISWPE
jgi:hypothetical protein